MKFDIFFSICQTPVDGYKPTEKIMWQNFFDQVRWADQLGYETAWVAETHLSCQTQKQNPGAVIPHFEGEIGLNTDLLQLAHIIFAETKNIHVGSAIRNIQCNGGPIAHAEAVRTFLSLHARNPHEQRQLHLGFAAGRFPFSNTPYGIRPRNELEKAAWPVVRGKVFQEAVEVFLRFLRGDIFSSKEVSPKTLSRKDFRSEDDWQKVLKVHPDQRATEIPLESRWVFDKVGVIPFEAPMENLRLVIGCHDAETQHFANQFLPVGVFNLSITPVHLIEDAHRRMREHFHPSGGDWKRWYMPRTVLVFIDDTNGISEDARCAKARTQAQAAMETYWKAMEGTLDPQKVAQAVDNALVGGPETVSAQIRKRFHPEDRVMLWFDFNNHNNQSVKDAMAVFREKVVPQLKDFRA